MNKIRTEFETNKSIKYIFGELIPSRTKEEQSKARRSDYLMFMNGTDIQTVSM